MTNQTPAAPPAAAPVPHAATHAAEDLLAGRTEARIALGDLVYTLRLTRAGKLILTK